jgi:pseudouridine kinase
MDEGYVLVIGAAGLDIKGRSNTALQNATSNPGIVRSCFGGVARNIAENLARLEIEVVLLSVVGNDAYGDLIMAQAATAGVNVAHVLQLDDQRSGSYVAILDDDGDLAVAVSDYEIIKYLDSAFLQDKIELFKSAKMIVLDLNLLSETLEKILEFAKTYQIPVCVDPTSPAHAEKIRPYLHQLYLITPNFSEVTKLCNTSFDEENVDSALNAAKELVSSGLKIAIVTLGSQGVVYASHNLSGHLPALKTHIVDSTGAGDALSAAVIYGLLNDISLEEAMRLGVTAATLTLRSRDSVVQELTTDLLYEHLIV